MRPASTPRPDVLVFDFAIFAVPVLETHSGRADCHFEAGADAHSLKLDEWITCRRERKKVEMLFAHLKRIMRLDRLRLRGPNGARDEFHLAAAAQNLRKLAKLHPVPQPAAA